MFVVLPMVSAGEKPRYHEQFKAKAASGRFYTSWAYVPVPKKARFVVFRSTMVPEASGGNGKWQSPVPMFKSVDVDGSIEWVRIKRKK